MSFWASNPSPVNASSFLVVLFFIGVSYLDGDNKLNNNYVRCVLGPADFAGAPSASGVTVTDPRTGLVWQQADDGMGKSWLAALSYCENLSLGGFSDWRLPSVKELDTIIDETATMWPFQFKAFALVGSLWSSTPEPFKGDFVWMLDVINNAGPVLFAPSEKANARCVRGP